jgi:hypothetical protein
MLDKAVNERATAITARDAACAQLERCRCELHLSNRALALQTAALLAGAQRRYLDALKSSLACLACGATYGVELESSRTRFPWNGVSVDPNARIPLCRPCAKEHHAYWDERWAEYRAGQM